MKERKNEIHEKEEIHKNVPSIPANKLFYSKLKAVCNPSFPFNRRATAELN